MSTAKRQRTSESGDDEAAKKKIANNLAVIKRMANKVGKAFLWYGGPGSRQQGGRPANGFCYNSWARSADGKWGADFQLPDDVLTVLQASEEGVDANEAFIDIANKTRKGVWEFLPASWAMDFDAFCEAVGWAKTQLLTRQQPTLQRFLEENCSISIRQGRNSEERSKSQQRKRS